MGNFQKLSNNLRNLTVDDIISKDERLEIHEKIIQEWIQVEIQNIFISGGGNIEDPFPQNKLTSIWQPYRKYNAFPSMWSLGVWSGATYETLAKRGKTNIGVDYSERVTIDQIVVDMDTGRNQYLNFSLGFSKNIVEKVETMYTDKIEENLEAIVGFFND